MPHGVFVLDASVTAAWLLPDEQSEAADRVYALIRAGVVDAHAPDLWLWECTNVIANGVRRSRIETAAGLQAWALLDATRTRVELTTLQPAQVRACLTLAVDLGLSVYDASYLWLAMSLNLPLLTRDARLAAAAARQSVEVIGVEDVA